jgi:hypothetical protein
MKHLSSSILFVALMSLLYLFTPCNAVAQNSGGITCCYNSPSGSDEFTNAGIQSMIMSAESRGHTMDLIRPMNLGSLVASSADDGLESQMSMQYWSKSQLFIADMKVIDAILGNEREIHYGERS